MNKYCFVFLSLWCIAISAQNPSTPENNSKNSASSFFDRTEFKTGYYGNFYWNPGWTFGAEYLWKEKVRTKEKKRGTKIITKQWLFNGVLGVSWNPRTELGVFTNYGILWRRTNTKGRQINLQFNPLGYYRAFLPETYEVSGSEVDKVFLPGRNYYAPSLSLGIGKLRKNRKSTGWYLNATYMLRTPYNANSLPSFAIEYGFRFNFKKQHTNDDK